MMSGGIDEYLNSVIAEFEGIPARVAEEAALGIFKRAVEETPEDSGQAAANWHIQAYTESSGGMSPFQIMWGYTGHPAVAPVGDKWSKGASREAVISQQNANADAVIAGLQGGSFSGISVYNPLSSPIPNFAPGVDTWYEENSIGKVKITEIVSEALEAAYGKVAKDFKAAEVA